jgi:hypothetical protein
MDPRIDREHLTLNAILNRPCPLPRDDMEDTLHLWRRFESLLANGPILEIARRAAYPGGDSPAFPENTDEILPEKTIGADDKIMRD